MDIVVDRSEPVSTLSVPQGTQEGVGIQLQQQQQPIAPAPLQQQPAQAPPQAVAPQPVSAPVATLPRHQVLQQQQQQQQQQPKVNFRAPASEVRKTFADFANPRKYREEMMGKEDVGGFDDEDDGEDDGDMDEGDGFDEDDGGGGEFGREDDGDEELYEDHLEPEEVIRPSEGFATIDEEKADIMFKLHRIRKTTGIPATRSFNMASDIREMRGELNRIKAEMDVEASIKFQRKLLMAFVSTMEFLNRRYDPFDLQLDGWSESVHTGIDDYNGVFERLHEKYKAKVSMAPEVELMFMVFGSAMMFHFSKQFFKQASLPGAGGMGGMNMAGLMSAMMNQQAAAGGLGGGGGGGGPPGPQPPPPGPSGPSQRREMRGPQMDLSMMMGGGGSGLPIPGGFPFLSPPQPSNTAAPSARMMPSPAGPSNSAAPRPQSRSVTFHPSTKRPAAQQIVELEQEEEELDAEDERNSDVVSDDMQDLVSVPDDLTSIGSGEDPFTGTKTIDISKGTGRKSAGKTGNKRSKTVLKL